MRKHKILGKIFGIALVFVMIGAMLSSFPIAANTIDASPDQHPIVAPGDLGYSTPRNLARTSDGVLHCVYSRSDGSYSQIYHSYSTDGGETWTEEQITDAPYRHSNPSIAIDSKDHIHVAWVYRHSSSRDYTTQYRVKTTSWQPIENVISGHHRSVAMAIDSEDNVHLAVGGMDAGAYHCDYVRYRKRTASGWGPTEQVSSACWAEDPAIAIDQNNNVHVVYTHSPRYGPHYGLRYRERTASGWQSEEVIQTDELDWSLGSIAIDSHGNVYVVYYLGCCADVTHRIAGPIKLSKRTSSG